jgi:aryl-alcohol dehydrogenase
VQAIKEITGGGVNYALESTGRPEILKQGIDALGTLGKIAVVGAPPLGTTAQFDVNDLLLGGKMIMGVVEGSGAPKNLFLNWLGFISKDYSHLINWSSFTTLNKSIRRLSTAKKGLRSSLLLKFRGKHPSCNRAIA